MPRPAGLSTGRIRTRTRAVVELFDAHPHAAVFGVALVVRLAAVVALPDAPYEQGGDAPRYLSIARDVLDGRAYGSSSGDTERVPLYQGFLALHLWLFGNALWVVAVTQAFVGAATAVVLTETANVLLPGPRRWIVGLLWALYPPSVLNTVVLFTQPLQVLWLSAAFLMLFSGLRHRSVPRCVLAALLWGLACLTRAGNLFFLPVFALAPLLTWRFCRNAGWRWRLAASVAMLAVGVSSVVWWTGREFRYTYRLEYLLSNPHERQTVALMLRPVEKLNVAFSERMRQWDGRTAVAAGPETVVGGGPAAATMSESVQPATTGPTASPGAASVPPRRWSFDILARWRMETRRVSAKLWQTFRAPDGLVQMQCRGPAGGYWSWFADASSGSPLQAVTAAFGSTCLALKSGAYIWHYVIMALSIPGFLMLAWRLPGVGMLWLLYLAYTTAIIILGSNYSNEIAAVPRFAFSVMPVPVMLSGLFLVSLLERDADPSTLVSA